jgi:uncharacterized small protein (DUF1192 family)
MKHAKKQSAVPANNGIEELINNKIAVINQEIEKLKTELKQFQKLKEDYELNRHSIETILGLQNAPDLAAPKLRNNGDKAGNG